MDYEEIEKLSLEESKRQTKERKEEGLNMIRPFTFDEKKLLWDGLYERKKTTSEVMTPEEEDKNAGIVRDSDGNVLPETTFTDKELSDIDTSLNLDAESLRGK